MPDERERTGMRSNDENNAGGQSVDPPVQTSIGVAVTFDVGFFAEEGHDDSGTSLGGENLKSEQPRMKSGAHMTGAA